MVLYSVGTGSRTKGVRVLHYLYRWPQWKKKLPKIMKILIHGGGRMGAHSTNYFNFTLIFLIFFSIFYTPPKKSGWAPPPPNATSLWWRAQRFIIFLQGLKIAKKKEQLINYKDSHFFSIYILKTIHRLMTGPFLNRRKYTQRQSIYGDFWLMHLFPVKR